MRWRGLLRLALVLLVILAAASWGVSRALQAGWGRRALLSRLSASFGRPVEVGSFGFNLFQGPQLEADSVTVAEDPRFGNEYFLRAEQITASLSWMALLRGRVEFRMLSLTNPSLNLVRTAEGSWNVENWLPAPSRAGPSKGATVRLSGAAAGPRVAHIQVEGGRINFKHGTEKLQFAFTDVRGSLDQDASGRWTVDIEAIPARATVTLQDVGALRVRGTVAGTSARLRPAHLSLTWENASLADALRIARGTDYGLRGLLGAEFSAAIENPVPSASASPAKWNFGGVVRLVDVHRWDLAARPADPELNLTVAASWLPGEPTLDVTHYAFDAPHSQLAGLARIGWAHGFVPSVEVSNSRIDAGDLLTWRRAFGSGVPEDLEAGGAIELGGKAEDWPLRIEDANVTSAGVTITTGMLPGAVRIGAIHGQMQRGVFTVDPVAVSLPGGEVAAPPGGGRGATRGGLPGGPAGVFRFTAELGPFPEGARPKEWTYRMVVAGQTSRVEDLPALARAFGWSGRANWSYEGPADLRFSWAGSLGDVESPSGRIDLHDLQLHTAILNQPLTISAASVQLGPDGRRVKFGEALAFGAHWTGSMHRGPADHGWTFDFTADHLDVAELDRWLGPRARPSLFERMLPFRGPSAPGRDIETAIAGIRASGRLRVDQLTVGSLQVAKLDASAELNGRTVRLTRAQAELYDGRIAGDFAAIVSADPSYVFRGTVDRVNLAVLTAETSELAGRFAGIASGALRLAARGIGREALLSSLEGDGSLRVRDAVAPIVNGSWAEPAEAGPPTATGVSRFAGGAVVFRVSKQDVRLDPLRLTDRDHDFEVTGTVDFDHRLDLRVRPVPHSVERGTSEQPELPANTWAVTGSLDDPRVTKPPNIAASVSGPTSSRR